MKDEEVTVSNLKKVDAVVLGVRALNTNDRNPSFHARASKLCQRWRNNGDAIQYQFWVGNRAGQIFSPFPITLSRDRVTQENSEVRILKAWSFAAELPK